MKVSFDSISRMKLFKLSSLIVLIFLTALAKAQIPNPLGGYACGRRTIVWTDSLRNDPWYDQQKRKLLLQVWFPVDDISKEYALYFPGGEKIKRDYTKKQRDMVLSIKTHSIESSTLSGKEVSYPVLLFSPGADMPPFFYTSILQELASNGFIVVAIDHTYEGIGQVFPDGTTTTADYQKFTPYDVNGSVSRKVVEGFYKKRVVIRREDAAFVLDKITSLHQQGDTFWSKADLNSVGIFGHSIGGVAAVQAAMKDSRFKAVINYDGLMAGMPYYSEFDVPFPRGAFMMIGKPIPPLSDKDLKSNKMTKQQDDDRIRRNAQRIDSVLTSMKEPAYRLTIAQATHQSFSDVPFFQADDLAGKKEILKTITDYTVKFLRSHLKGDVNDLSEITSAKLQLKMYGTEGRK